MTGAAGEFFGPPHPSTTTPGDPSGRQAWRTSRTWDTRIAWNYRRQRWWWSAWHRSTGEELWGFAEVKERAFADIAVAIAHYEQQCDTDPLGIPQISNQLGQ